MNNLGDITQYNQAIVGMAPNTYTFTTSKLIEINLEVISTSNITLELNNINNKLIKTQLIPGEYRLQVLDKGPYRIKYNLKELEDYATSYPINRSWEKVELNNKPKYKGLTTQGNEPDTPLIWTEYKGAYKLTGDRWKELHNGNCEGIFPDPSKPNRLLILKNNNNNWKLIISDGGALESNLTFRIGEGPINKKLGFNPWLPQHILLAGERLYESLDGGLTWKDNKLREILTPGAKIIGVYFNPKREGRGHIHVWTSMGVYQSTDSGNHWSKVLEEKVTDLFPIENKLMYLMRGQAYIDGLPISYEVNTISQHPYKDKEILIGGGKLVYSIDGGGAWKKINFPGGRVKFIHWNKYNPRRVWVVGDGLFELQDLYSNSEPNWREQKATVNEDYIHDLNTAKDRIYIAGSEKFYTFKSNPIKPIKAENREVRLISVREGEVMRAGPRGIEGLQDEVWRLIKEEEPLSMAFNKDNLLYADSKGLNNLIFNITTLPKDPQRIGKVYPDRKDYVFYYQLKNKFFRAEDGEGFNQVYHDLPQSWEELTLVPSPIEGEVWAAYGFSGLFKSHDYGERFHKVEGVSYVQRVCLGPPIVKDEPYAVYMVGKVRQVAGVFRSRDLGNTWAKLKDLPESEVTCMAASLEAPGLILIGTDGQGVYYCFIDTPLAFRHGECQTMSSVET